MTGLCCVPNVCNMWFVIRDYWLPVRVSPTLWFLPALTAGPCNNQLFWMEKIACAKNSKVGYREDKWGKFKPLLWSHPEQLLPTLNLQLRAVNHFCMLLGPVIFQSNVTYFRPFHQMSRNEMSNSELLCLLDSSERASFAKLTSLERALARESGCQF